jgi:hypothetical protein
MTKNGRKKAQKGFSIIEEWPQKRAKDAKGSK